MVGRPDVSYFLSVLRNLPILEPPAVGSLFKPPPWASEYCQSRLNGCTSQATGELQFSSGLYHSSSMSHCWTSGRTSYHELRRSHFSLAACKGCRIPSWTQVMSSRVGLSQLEDVSSPARDWCGTRWTWKNRKVVGHCDKACLAKRHLHGQTS